MPLEPHQYRDPGEVVATVAATHSLAAGDVLLALVHEPSTRQEIVQVTRLPTGNLREEDDFHGRSEVLRQATEAMPLPDWPPGGPKHSIMTIVARRGATILRGNEMRWLRAWLFANHLKSVYTMELVLVTEHGWVDFETGWGGDEPRLPITA